MDTCQKCWSNPCVCGTQYEGSTTDHILLLIDGLVNILQQRDVPITTTVNNQEIKEYLLEKNRGKSYGFHSSILTVLEESGVALPDVYKTHIRGYRTVGDVYHNLKMCSIPYKTAFGVLLYENSLAHTDTSLQQFFFKILETYTVLFDNKKLKDLLRYDVNHVTFRKNLFQAVYQVDVILKEKLPKDLSPELMVAWLVLMKIDSFYQGDLNVKYQAIKEITEILSGRYHCDLNHIHMETKPVLSTLDTVPRSEYECCELEDEDLLSLLLDPDICKPPYFGMLKTY